MELKYCWVLSYDTMRTGRIHIDIVEFVAGPGKPLWIGYLHHLADVHLLMERWVFYTKTFM